MYESIFIQIMSVEMYVSTVIFHIPNLDTSKKSKRKALISMSPGLTSRSSKYRVTFILIAYFTSSTLCANMQLKRQCFKFLKLDCNHKIR